MIKINLLPQEMIGGAKSSASSGGGGTALVVLILLLIFGLDIAVGAYLFKLQNDAKQELASVTKEYDGVKKSLDAMEVQYNETRMDIERMEKLIKVAEALDPSDRLLWARKLNMLPSLVPEGVYLTEINVSQKVREKETDESIKARNDYVKAKAANKAKGPMPPIVKIPVITQQLDLRAIAYVPDGTSTQRLQQLNAFYKNLQSKDVQVPFDREPKRFMEGFQPVIQPSSLLGKVMDGREVSVFSFTLQTIPLEIR
jgi:Tfp pilus assembly protein PilN